MNTRHRPLDGQVIVVTGAGTGTGRATAVEAAVRGARLVVVGRRRCLLDETAHACGAHGATPMILAMDVTLAEAPAQIVDAVACRFGRIDGLVNNAGLARFCALEGSRDEDILAMLAVNLLAPLRLIRAAAGTLRAAGGAVVNVSSIGGVVATPGRAAYGATKAALNHLTRSLARELAPDIRVNAVLPGAVDTPMYDDLGLDATTAVRLKDEMIRTTPAGRMGRPDEVARWICHLLDRQNAWVTGSLVTIDGGRSC